MRWNLLIVAIAMCVPSVPAWSQQSDAPRTSVAGESAVGAGKIRVSDDGVVEGAARISVGDAGPPQPPADPGAPAALPNQPPPAAGYGNAPLYTQPSCGVAGCTSRGCTNPGCASPAWGPSSCAANGCTDPACYGGRGCRPRLDTWGAVEYMHVWTKGQLLPPLVTQSTVGAHQGIIGQATTTTLFPGDRIGNGLQAGGRATIGKWFDDGHLTGAGVRLMGIEGDRTNFTANSNQFGTLARPFFDPTVPGERSQIIAVPAGVVPALLGQGASGNVAVNSSTDVYAAEAFFRFNLEQDIDYRVDLIGGYHFTMIDDGFSVRSQSTINLGPPALFNNFVFDLLDVFDCKNSFHGGEIGIAGEYGEGPWTLSMLAKVSLGQMHQQVTISGQSIVTDALLNQTVTPGGVLALGANLGNWSRNRFAYIPEVAVNLNRELNSNWDLSIGYSFVYWSSVVLAGDQVDRQVNSSQLFGGALVGANRPQHTFMTTDYWLHALNFGLTYRY